MCNSDSASRTTLLVIKSVHSFQNLPQEEKSDMGALVNISCFYSLKRNERAKNYPFSVKQLEFKQSFAHIYILLIYNIYIYPQK